MSISQGDRARGYTTFIQTHISHDGLAGWFAPGDRDGWFGPQTKGQVEVMQSARGIVDDGIVGPQTWGFMHTQMTYDTEVLYDWFDASGVLWTWERWEIRWANDDVYKVWSVNNSVDGWRFTDMFSHGLAGPNHVVRRAGT